MALLSRVLPEAQRDGILGDLREVHASRTADRGRLRTWLWFWAQTLPLVLAFARERLRDRASPVGCPIPRVGAREGMMRFAADLKFAWRMAVKNPWMSAAASLSLGAAMAVAIGGFSLIWDSAFAVLPFEHGDRIVAIRDLDRVEGGRRPPRLAVFEEWQRRQTTFDLLGASFRRLRDVGDGAGGFVRYPVATMTPSGFAVTGVAPQLGRTLTSADGEPGARPVVVIGARVWRALLGADRGVIGRSVSVGGEDRVIVGVMPDGFRFPMSEDLWIPFPADTASFGGVEPRWLQVFGRLADGVTPERAESELEAIRAGYAAGHPEDSVLRDRGTTLVPYVKADSEPGSEALFLGMFVFVLLVLVVACASVANLLLGRAMSRRGELAVRAALGASRGRLIAQLFIEAWLLTSAGAAIGVTAAHVSLAWFKTYLLLEGLPFWVRFDISPPTVVFAFVAAFGAAVLAGVVPALKATSVSLNDVLKDEQRSASGLRFGAISGALTAVEVAFAVAFLAAAGLAARSLLDAETSSRDLRTREVLVASVSLADEAGIDAAGEIVVAEGAIPSARWSSVAEQIRAACARLPTVVFAVLADRLPVQQHPSTEIELDGEAPGGPTAGVRVLAAAASADLFDAFNGRWLAGRRFRADDTSASEPVAVVNASFAHRFFGNGSPVGRRFRPVAGRTPTAWITIVGVVEDLPMNPAGNRQAGFYRPFAQTTTSVFQLAIRVNGDLGALPAAVKEAVERIDPRIDVAGFQTQEEAAQGMLTAYKMMSLIFVGLGAAALFLAVAGLYAVMAFAVTQRTREIGIRVALGATGSRIMRVVLRGALRQITIGMAVGGAGGWALQRLLSLIPIGISPGGPVLLAAAAAAMLVAGLGACIVPVSRVLRIHPVAALRHD